MRWKGQMSTDSENNKTTQILKRIINSSVFYSNLLSNIRQFSLLWASGRLTHLMGILLYLK